MNQPYPPSASAPMAEPMVQHLTSLYGMPGDRLARLAARRSFALMKQCFMRAVQDLGGVSGDVLRRKVRHADDPLDLWRLRRAVMAVLPDNTAERAALRAEIQQHLDSLYPDSLHTSGPQSL